MCPPENRWYIHNENEEDNGPVIVSEKKIFRLEYIKEVHGTPIYTICPVDTDKEVGVIVVIGANGEEVVTKVYPVVPDVAIPAWAFYPSKPVE